MGLINRLRRLFQEPWFVGVLSLIAVLYVVRNIVLPIVRMQSGGSYVAASSDADDRPAAVGTSGGGFIAGSAPSRTASSRTRIPADLPARRADWFDGPPQLGRNPFLAADDPRQPGFRAPLAAAPAATVAVAVPPAPIARPNLGLKLGAVMATPGGRLALVNRQVVAEGDSVIPDDGGASDGPYRIESIGEREVVLSGRAGRIRLVLPEG